MHASPHRKPSWPFLAAVLGALLVGFVTPVAADAPEPVPVTVDTVEALSIFPSSSAPGTAVTLNDARISAEVAGTVLAMPVQVGDTVDAGALLAELDCASHSLAVTQAEARLDAAGAERELAAFQLRQMKKMQAGEFASVELVKQREAGARRAAAEVKRLQAALDAARRQVEKCRLRAPFKAVVIERNASVGDLASPGMQLVRLVDRVQLEVSGRIQEQDLARLQEARGIEFVSRDRRYPLALRTVVPVIDSRLRSYEARFVFSADKAAPGEAGRVEWVSSRRHLPPSVLVRRDGSMGVFIVEDGRARFRAIPEAREGYPAPTSLALSTPVIVDGRFGLGDGAAIRVVRR